MHYYQFNIGDYRKDTSHLKPMEHYIYRTLIDWYYLDEKPIPNETQSVIRRLCLGNQDVTLLQNVLKDYFVLTEIGWKHERIEREILLYAQKKDTNRENGKKGGRPKNQVLTENENPEKTQSVIFANRNESELNPNHKPITNNQEPITNNQEIKTNTDIVETKVSTCPIREIINLYHEQLPMLAKVVAVTSKRKTHLQTRWKEDEQRQTMEFWKWYFTKIARSRFLTGKTESKDGRSWKADFDFVINENNMIKIIEGKYDN